MSWSGTISASIATLFSLIALNMFFNTDAAIKFAVILSYLVLVVAISGILVTLMRWFHLSNTVLREQCGCYSNVNKKYRIYFVVLGTICVIAGLFSSVGIFIFSQKLGGISNQILNATAEKEEAEPVELEPVDWYVAACNDDPEGVACVSCEGCASSYACDVCQEDLKRCEKCQCGNSKAGIVCRLASAKFVEPEEDETEKEEKKASGPLEKLENFLGEPDPDSECYNIRYGLKGIKRKFCQLYEMTDSFHCKNGTDTIDPEEIVNRLRCIADTVGVGAKKRLTVAVLLLLAVVGFIVHIIAAIRCYEEQPIGYGYRKTTVARK